MCYRSVTIFWLQNRRRVLFVAIVIVMIVVIPWFAVLLVTEFYVSFMFKCIIDVFLLIVIYLFLLIDIDYLILWYLLYPTTLSFWFPTVLVYTIGFFHLSMSLLIILIFSNKEQIDSIYKMKLDFDSVVIVTGVSSLWTILTMIMKCFCLCLFAVTLFITLTWTVTSIGITSIQVFAVNLTSNGSTLYWHLVIYVTILLVIIPLYCPHIFRTLNSIIIRVCFKLGKSFRVAFRVFILQSCVFLGFYYGRIKLGS